MNNESKILSLILKSYAIHFGMNRYWRALDLSENEIEEIIFASKRSASIIVTQLQKPVCTRIFLS